MENQNTSQSGYSGDNLIGYSGLCEKCGEERRIYYARCRGGIKRKMVLGLRSNKLDYVGVCEVCVTRGVKDTVRTWRLMARVQVDKDLKVLDGFTKIDFAQAQNDVRENLKNDKWLEDNEQHVVAFNKWRDQRYHLA